MYKSEMLNDFNAYKDGNKIIGTTAEFTLPEIETPSETISMLGMIGEIDVPAVGKVSAMEMEIPFNNLADDIYSFFDLSAACNLTLRGAMQVIDPATHAKSFLQTRIVIRGSVKKITTGTFKPASPGNPSVTTTVNYILIEYNGQQMLEIDKENCVFKVKGKDILADITKNC